MATQKVNIEVSTRGAKKSQEELKGLRGTITNLGKAVGVASAAYFGASGLINSFSRVIDLAGQQQKAENDLKTALGRTSTALIDQAETLQEFTKFGDEATLQQMAFLASIGKTEDQIMDIIPVAMDLAEATGMSLESAVRNTAKTFSGLAGELGELVPQLRDLTAEEMKSGEAVRVLADLFGGTAQAQTETLTGKLQQMNNAIGDAGEEIGLVLAPMVIKVADGIKTLAEGVGEVTEKFKNFGQEVDSSLLTPTQLAEQEVDAFARSLKDKSLPELIQMGEELGKTGEKFNMMIIPMGEASNLTNTFGLNTKQTSEQMEIQLGKQDEIINKINSEIERRTELIAKIEEEREAQGGKFNVIEQMENEEAERRALAFENEINNIDFIKDADTISLQERANARSIFNDVTTELANSDFDMQRVLMTRQADMFRKAGIDEIAIAQFVSDRKKQIRLNEQEATLGAVANMMNAFAGLNTQARGLAIASKRLLQGEAIMNTYAGAAKAFAQGGFLGFATGAAIIAQGLSYVAKIEAQQFNKGGIVPGTGNTDSVPAMLTPGEVILNEAQQKNLTGKMGGITINVSAPLVDETIIDTIIPAIEKAKRLNLA